VLDTIWFAEGFGQYAAIMAVAAGTDDPAAFREGMLNRRFRANVASAPAFLSRMTLTELSRVASTRYSEDFRTAGSSSRAAGCWRPRSTITFRRDPGRPAACAMRCGTWWPGPLVNSAPSHPRNCPA
jgi:hypothetical protein